MPLALGEEPAPRKLDGPIDIDRREGGRPDPEPAPRVSPPAPRNETAAVPRAVTAPLPRSAPAAVRAAPASASPEKAAPAARAAPPAAPRKEEALPARSAPAPAERAELAPGAREAIPPARRPERPPAPSALERSHWSLGPVGKAAGAAVLDVTGPVEMGLPPRSAGAEGPTGAPGRPAGEPGGPAAEPGRPAGEPGGAREVHLRRPEDWRRAAAWGIDAGPFLAGAIALARALVREAGASASAPGAGLLGLLDLVARERLIVLSVAATAALAFLVYATLSHALAGATLGKRILRLRVVTGDGQRPSLGRSAARSCLAALSGALLGLGLLLALFTRSGRALHDVLARTWVVEVP